MSFSRRARRSLGVCAKLASGAARQRCLSVALLASEMSFSAAVLLGLVPRLEKNRAKKVFRLSSRPYPSSERSSLRAREARPILRDHPVLPFWGSISRHRRDPANITLDVKLARITTAAGTVTHVTSSVRGDATDNGLVVEICSPNTRHQPAQAC